MNIKEFREEYSELRMQVEARISVIAGMLDDISESIEEMDGLVSELRDTRSKGKSKGK